MKDSISSAPQTGRTLKFAVEGNFYTSEKQYLTGKEIKEIAHLPLESELFLTVNSPWKDEAIDNNETVDLARPGIEGFYVKKKLKYTIDCQEFESDRQYIFGSEIRKQGKIPDGYQIFLSIKGPYDDELIQDSDRVDLARPGIEHFYGCKPNTTNG